MKRFAILAVIACAFLADPAFAFDYVTGQCRVPLSTCWIGSNATSATSPTFSDTYIVSVGDGGMWKYESSTDVEVSGGRFCPPTSGHAGQPIPCSIVKITSAFLDGVPMTAPVSGYTWVIPISLTPGQHKVAVTGTSGGAPGRWTGAIQGITYSPVSATETQ